MTDYISEQPKEINELKKENKDGSVMGALQSNEIFIMKRDSWCSENIHVFDKEDQSLFKIHKPTVCCNFTGTTIVMSSENTQLPSETIEFKRNSSCCCCPRPRVEVTSPFGSSMGEAVNESICRIYIRLKSKSGEDLGTVQEFIGCLTCCERRFNIFTQEGNQVGQVVHHVSIENGCYYKITLTGSLDVNTKTLVFAAIFMFEE